MKINIRRQILFLHLKKGLCVHIFSIWSEKRGHPNLLNQTVISNQCTRMAFNASTKDAIRYRKPQFQWWIDFIQWSALICDRYGTKIHWITFGREKVWTKPKHRTSIFHFDWSIDEKFTFNRSFFSLFISFCCCCFLCHKFKVSHCAVLLYVNIFVHQIMHRSPSNS